MLIPQITASPTPKKRYGRRLPDAINSRREARPESMPSAHGVSLFVHSSGDGRTRIGVARAMLLEEGAVVENDTVAMLGAPPESCTEGGVKLQLTP